MSELPPDLSNVSMLEIFRVEVENQTAVLNQNLLELERVPTSAQRLEALMRAAHSLKGAAQIVQLPVVSRLAHALEDCFVAAQRGEITIGRKEMDVLLRGVDFFAKLSQTPESELVSWETDQAVEVEGFVVALRALIAGGAATPAAPPMGNVSAETDSAVQKTKSLLPAAPGIAEVSSGILRVSSETVDRLLGLAGESLVESRRLQPFAVSMQRLKRLQAELSEALDALRETMAEIHTSARVDAQLAELSARVAACRRYLAGRIEELDVFDRQAARLSNRLYQETLQVRMCPFGDGVKRFPRMVRDLARSLDKNVRLEISGEQTQVDREILERLDAPLTHLLRNALDHGCEAPDERQRRNKPVEAVVKLEARHSAGMLQVDVIDDGRGIEVEELRGIVTQKQLVVSEVAERLTEAELMEFLFLPGFSTKADVTEMSGRGVGLDVVREMVKAVHGKIRVSAQPGSGTRFQLLLPLSLAVLRALLVQVADEPYALPLAQIFQTVKLPPSALQVSGGRRFFDYQGEQVGLVMTRMILGRTETVSAAGDLTVVILGDRGRRFGLVVEKLLGEQELVVQPLDARLGKIRDVSAAATLEDGSPVLILDVEDLVLSVEKHLLGEASESAGQTKVAAAGRRTTRVLVVDDSITVRELQRKVLTEHGYEVVVAVDGMDAWNNLRSSQFDVVVSDVDMPRMDGLELVARIKNDTRLRSLPVVLLSHKEREEDRLRGLAAGAHEYLPKSGYQEEKLLQLLKKVLSNPEK